MPKNIVEDISLQLLINFVEAQQVQVILIRYTYFSYLTDVLSDMTKLVLINFSKLMIENLRKIINLQY